ncbi:hypothetical protein [Micromonospora deserti]|uniref:Proteinase inhibitor I4 serpin n=1 Tax=Micromonospora deserti TaxID=2070366 RepID=A0A2W2CXV0_9ACTN|nr:hypothetical protein [Micromonospora deserti]PZF96428.1 hypothetical protein C1I99_17170 [Micromonospora deserti]
MTTDIRTPLARYAERLHAHAGDRHHVASPLGAWLLLALAAPAATGPTRAALEEVLGTEGLAAADAASALLAEPHPLVPSATAVWHRPDFDTPQLDGWRTTLPRSTERGPLPDQEGLDAWAREHTLGLIDRFPLKVGPEVLLALASALATRISWEQPFEVAPAAALDSAAGWGDRLTRVLRSPRRGHRCAIAATERAGDVIVHAAPARAAATNVGEAGLVVVSVAAAPDVPPADVLAAGYEVSAGAADGSEPAGRRSLFDLPLGETALWTVREERIRTRAPDGREERHTALLPCWSARSEHDLSDPRLGFAAVNRALTRSGLFEARQAAMARYGRYGFEAAAVTGHFDLVSLPPEGVARIAELRFGHPYAVVALATDRRPGAPWHGVPVFSAWVADPEELPESDAVDRPDGG